MTEVHLDPRRDTLPEAGALAMGAELRRLREARGETPGDVAHSLKLTGRQVEAMETGRLDQLPGPAFARGFLRNYARYLGLDPVAVLDAFAFDTGTKAVELMPVSNAEGVMPSGRAGRAIQFPAALVVGALLLAVALGAYFDWFRLPGEKGADSDNVAGQRSPESGNERESALAPVSEPVAPSVGESGIAAVAPLQSLNPAPVAATAVPQQVIAPPAPVVAPPTGGVEVKAAVPAATPPVAGAPAADGVEHLVFRFEGESWVEVRDASGAIIYSGINGAGASRTVQGKAPFALVVGNAKQVSLDYRGKPYDLQPHVRVSVARFTLE